MPLADIEKSFVTSLLQPETNDKKFLSELLPLDSLRGALNEEKQLYIYRSNVNGAYQKVLGQIYPACLNILGEDYFNQLCRAYRFEHPSTEPDLNIYGELFAIFISEQLKVHNELTDFEYLADLARLEWHWHSSYYAKDELMFDFEKLMSINPAVHDRLIFRLNDSFSLHATAYPLLDIWQVNKSGKDNKQEFLMPESECYYCISRVAFSPELAELTCAEYKLLKLILDGLPLNQLSENGDGDFQSYLLKFIQKSWVSGFLVQD